MNKNFFEVNNVDFNVGNKTKVKNVSFAIENQGDVICLLGPSGIGKTTILRTIAGLEKLKKGSIILNIASDLSSIAPNHNIYPRNNYKPISYSVIKHGVVGITKYLATYLNRYNIRCNTLSPGSVKNMQPKTFINKIKKLIPLNRLARHNEYHGAIKFLCTDASSYMNGQNIIIDGGRSIW